MIYDRHPELQSKWDKAFWARGYYVSTMEETFDTPFYLQRNIQVNFSSATSEWRITGKSAPSIYDVNAYVTYGTNRENAYKILEETLNLKVIRIFDTYEDADEKKKRVLNKKGGTEYRGLDKQLPAPYSWIPYGSRTVYRGGRETGIMVAGGRYRAQRLAETAALKA